MPKKPAAAEPAPAEVRAVRDLEAAATMLTPLRMRILEALQEPASAASLAQQLDVPRQRLGYHVRELARAGFIQKAGRSQRRGFVEQRFVAVARRFVITPPECADLGGAKRAASPGPSSHMLLSLAARTQDELAQVVEEAHQARKPLSTLSVHADIRFESAAQRAEFARALSEAVAAVVAKHTSPAVGADGAAGTGRPYRLVLGCYPPPPGARFGEAALHAHFSSESSHG
ncbi:MAG: helix-turn-helix transcriptional regulator [Planctomycetes bacterium]|nr:helix-turn-helix transcriptional regulator [Planctomycetota bacterium]